MADSIATLGLSGLPLNDIMSKMRTVEEAPLQVLANRKAALDTRLSAYGVISGALTTFAGAARTVASAATFSGLSAVSSQPSALTASAAANGAGVAGRHAIEVQRLASTQTLSSTGQASRTTAIGTGSGDITFTFGNGERSTLALAPGEASLEGIRKAINASGGGLAATLINDGSANAPHVLSLATTHTGTAARIARIDVTGNPELAATLAYDETAGPPGAGLRERVAATDAGLTVNGIPITSGSNVVTDAIDGVTLTLQTTTAGPATLTVTADTAPALAAVEAFVSNYNNLASVLRNATRYDVQRQQGSALTGERVPREIQAAMREALSQPVAGARTTLAQLGIRTDTQTGTLLVDKDRLARAVRDDPAAVSSLFGGDGLGARVGKAISAFQGYAGRLNQAEAGVRQSAKAIDAQAETLRRRVEDTLEQMRRRFVQLERHMAAMNETSTYLTRQLDALAGSNRNNR